LTLASGRQCTGCLFPRSREREVTPAKQRRKQSNGERDNIRSRRVSFNSALGYLGRKTVRQSLRLIVVVLVAVIVRPMALATNWQVCFLRERRENARRASSVRHGFRPASLTRPAKGGNVRTSGRHLCDRCSRRLTRSGSIIAIRGTKPRIAPRSSCLSIIPRDRGKKGVAGEEGKSPSGIASRARSSAFSADWARPT